MWVCVFMSVCFFPSLVKREILSGSSETNCTLVHYIYIYDMLFLKKHILVKKLCSSENIYESIPSPTVQAFYSPGIVGMSIIRNLHLFLIIVLKLLPVLELLQCLSRPLFRKTNKKNIKQRGFHCQLFCITDPSLGDRTST